MNLYIWLISLFIFLVIYKGFSFINQVYKELKIMRYTEKFELYINVLEYYMQKAYNVIYKDKLLIYSIESTKVDEKSLTKYSKDFIILLLSIMGPSLSNIFIELYGGETAFYKNALDYFHSSYDNDEIRETSIDQMMNDNSIQENNEVK